MSNFKRSHKFTTEFDGDVVTAEVSNLKRQHFLLMAPFFDKDGKMKSGKDQEMIDVVVKILPEYVAKFKGLKDNEGKELQFKDIVNEIYFLDLVSDIFEFIMDKSVLKGSDEKK